MPIDTSFQAIAAVTGLVLLAAWESLTPFFSFFRKRERGIHFARNIVLGAVNSLAIAFGFVWLWALAAQWSAENNFGFLYRIDSTAIRLLLAIILMDIWTYLWHMLNHRVPFLWRFHRVHHSDNKMDVSTASRFHLGEIILSSALRVPLIAILGVTLQQLIIYETLLFAVVQFHHANIALPPALDRLLRLVIVTPAMHKVHHSRLQPETDSNYSSLLSLWDRVGRTFRLRAKLNEIDFGLEGYDDDASQSIRGLAEMPTRKVER